MWYIDSPLVAEMDELGRFIGLGGVDDGLLVGNDAREVA